MRKQTLIDHFGGTQKAVAEALGYTKQAVSRWKPDRIPLRAAYKAELVTNGRLRVDRREYFP